MGGIEIRDRPIVQQAGAEEAEEAAVPARLTRARPRPRPRGLVAAWIGLAVLAGLEGLHELTGFGGHDLFDNWLHAVLMIAATGLCIARAVHDPHGRGAWLAFGAALGLWALGDLAWTILYSTDADPPYPTIADVLWLAWYPLVALAIGLLIRTHVTRFELHRWMDGLAVMLIVLIPGFAFVVQPVSESTDNSALSTIVDFAYPILDVVILGALLGVFSLLAWRPGRTWLALGLGCGLIAVSDAALAVLQARGEFNGDWTFTLTVGAIVITYAAWASAAEDEGRETYGWRAIALAVAAQVLAGAIQIYGLFHELGASERIVTLGVLAIATTQIIITRPRPPGEE